MIRQFENFCDIYEVSKDNCLLFKMKHDPNIELDFYGEGANTLIRNLKEAGFNSNNIIFYFDPLGVPVEYTLQDLVRIRDYFNELIEEQSQFDCAANKSLNRQPE